MKTSPAFYFTLIILLFFAGCVNIKLGDEQKSRSSSPPRQSSPSQSVSSTSSSSPSVSSQSSPSPSVASQSTASQPSAQSTSPASDSWQDTAADIAGKIFLGSSNNTIFYAFDTLAYPNQPIELTARLHTTKIVKYIPDVTVGFYLNDQLIDLTQTNQDGLAVITWTPPAVGDYVFYVKIIDLPQNADPQLLQIAPAPLIVAAREKSTEFVIVDLDHTVVDSSFFRVLLGGGTPMLDSVEVLHHISQKFSIIYLTHRPDLMTARSKNWLFKHSYPIGPLLVSELKQAFGSSGKFKSAKISSISQAYPNIKIGIGDKLSDAQAYVDQGLTAYLLPHYDPDDKNDIRNLARQLRYLPEDRLNVVGNWQQIESGIFQGKQFPPKNFAAWLDNQAEQIKERKDN